MIFFLGGVLDLYFFKNNFVIWTYLSITIIYISGFFLFIRYLRITNKIVFGVIFTILQISTFIGIIVITQPIVLGNYYFKNGMYKDASVHYLNFQKRYENNKIYNFIYNNLMNNDFFYKFKKNLMISLYSSKKYDKFILFTQNNDESINFMIKKNEIPFYLFYLSHSYYEIGQIKSAKTLFYKSYLMALSDFDKNQLEIYENLIKTTYFIKLLDLN